MVKRALVAIGIVSDLEIYGLVLSDGRWPDGVTITAVEAGKLVASDVTVCCTVAISHVAMSSTVAGAAACKAEVDKIAKYRKKLPHYLFQPLVLRLLVAGEKK